MLQWVRKGVGTGIKTTAYPRAAENAAGVSPGRPVGSDYPEEQIPQLLARCPVGAISRSGQNSVKIDYRRCVHCFRCARGIETPLKWEMGYEWANIATEHSQEVLGKAFKRSVNVLVVDTGDCGACLNEVKQLNNPYYNMHRLGFFITPTPRLADVLMIVGPVTDHMIDPLKKVYHAMPTPRRIIAVGTCALSGGVFVPSFACKNGPGDLLTVDVAVPGNPPPPLAILDGLLVSVGRKPGNALESVVEKSTEVAN